jgi:hypothetical protein
VDATDVIAAIALAVSIGAGVAAIVSLVLQFRESARRDVEIRLLRDEAGRRDEELGLLRQQVARQEQAHISVNEHVPSGRGGSETYEYDVPIVNTGHSIARDVYVELVGAENAVVGRGNCDRPLAPGETAAVRISIPSAGYAGPYAVFAGWNDGRGPNREASGVRVGEA